MLMSFNSTSSIALATTYPVQLEPSLERITSHTKLPAPSRFRTQLTSPVTIS